MNGGDEATNPLDGITIVTEPAAEQLNERQLFDYRSEREACLEWLLTFGKDPEKADGYAFQTVRNHGSRMDMFYRWVWDRENRYTTDVTHEHADAWMKHLARRDTSKRQQELAYTSDWLSEFTSMVSHDLRNPLGVARMYLDFARDTGDDADFDAVAEALDQMDAMIDSMLTVARADRTVSDTDRLPLRELVTEAWASTTADDASLQADIPSEIFVDGDRRLLGDVFEHLFQNSIEHNDTPVTVTVTLLDGDSTGIAVEDDGDGIPADQREEVFDQGFTTAEDSVGFGLAIVSGSSRPTAGT